MVPTYCSTSHGYGTLSTADAYSQLIDRLTCRHEQGGPQE